ncbi:MAG: hypothetical protein IJ228_11555 [Succinivibrio sp.]|nr:hypothetical protein [Succinivibrio sp.]
MATLCKGLYTLMLRDYELCSFKLFAEISHGEYLRFYLGDALLNESCSGLLPRGLTYNRAGTFDRKLQQWVENRCAFEGRRFGALLESAVDGISSLNFMRFADATRLLGVTDNYWIRREPDKVTWKDINLFTHSFNDDLGTLALTGERSGPSYSYKDRLISAEYKIEGAQGKCWRHRGEGLVLLKSDFSSERLHFIDQVHGEYFASQVAQALGLNAVPYDIELFPLPDGRTIPVSVCPCFCTEDWGACPVLHALPELLGDNTPDIYAESIYDVQIGEKLGVDNFALMRVFDAVILNTDRHKLNYGLFLHNEDNSLGEMLPLYDQGRSLGADFIIKDALPSAQELIEFCPNPVNDYSFRQSVSRFITSDICDRVAALTDFEFHNSELYPLDDEKFEIMSEVLSLNVQRVLALGRRLSAGFTPSTLYFAYDCDERENDLLSFIRRQPPYDGKKSPSLFFTELMDAYVRHNLSLTALTHSPFIAGFIQRNIKDKQDYRELLATAAAGEMDEFIKRNATSLVGNAVIADLVKLEVMKDLPAAELREQALKITSDMLERDCPVPDLSEVVATLPLG